MDFSQLLKYAYVVYRELWQRKFLCLFGFAVISFTILVIGMYWPLKFETSATIFADNQNILKPLLSKQAAQSDVQNQAKVVRDMIHSPRILRMAIEKGYGIDSFESAESLGLEISRLRSEILVERLGDNYIKIDYSDSTSKDAYRVINSVIDVFIRTSADEQRSESRDAFLFIDNQVKQYKDQLLLAEERLKEFRSSNFDGRDIDVNASISKLRAQIEELKISLEEDRTTIISLKKQLAEESKFSSKKFKADVYSERLVGLEERKSTLLLNYTEGYPDVVSLTYQIEDIKRAMLEGAGGATEGDDGVVDEVRLNPLYQELRSRLSFIQTQIKAKDNRLIAFDALQNQEYERRKRIAERGAEESELTRDYTVTKRIYEDMLERKEKARLSMTLNIEGQGVTYRIQEPALPPLNPVGLQFVHFVVLGPILGFGGILGLAFVFVMLDQRIRFSERLDDLNVTTLAIIPHINTPFTKRIVRSDMLTCLLLGCLIMAVYIVLAYASKMELF